jgi:hypothetical protein
MGQTGDNGDAPSQRPDGTPTTGVGRDGKNGSMTFVERSGP